MHRPNPTTIHLHLLFGGEQTDDVYKRLRSILIESAPRHTYQNLLAIEVGDILIAIDNFTVTLIPIISGTTTPMPQTNYGNY